jgi:hypothetical protein
MEGTLELSNLSVLVEVKPMHEDLSGVLCVAYPHNLKMVLEDPR